MNEYIMSLEKEFSLIENGFKEEEKRAFADYKTNENEYNKNLAFLAYKSNIYQLRMYGVFLFGYLSSDEEILMFMRDEVSKDNNWRVQEVLAKAFDGLTSPLKWRGSLTGRVLKNFVTSLFFKTSLIFLCAHRTRKSATPKVDTFLVADF